MRVIAFRHSPFDDLGLIASILDTHGIAWQYADSHHTPVQEDGIQDADALILLGGSMSANDDLPFIHREIEYIHSAIQSRKPVLGICLGAQLIAKALGSEVYPNGRKEIGWEPVEFTDAATNDPVFRHCYREVVFHWHGETFNLPQGSELLASSAACRNQAFRFTDHVYALQFHLEVMPQMISRWCQEDEACGTREATEPIDPNAHSVRATALAHLVFGRWCELAKAQTEPRRRSVSS